MGDILTFEPVRERTNNDGDEDEASKHLKFPYEQQITFISSDNDEEDNIETVCVFGGDIWDKGGNDLYVIRQLISFRQRYGPERVIFIMGNRDINKMRIFAEVVGCSRDFNEPPTHGGLFWRKGTGKLGDPDLIKKGNGDLEPIVPSGSMSERLKWILSETMGAPNAFELHRKELRQEKRTRLLYSDDNIDEDDVTDEEVCRSYVKECSPTENGAIGLYLSYAKLAHHETGRKCIGGGVMFLHGALPIPSGEKLLLSRHNDFNWDNYYTPWIGLNISGNIDSAANNNEDSKPNNSQSKGKNQDNESGFKYWIERLNTFKQGQVDAWRTWHHYHHNHHKLRIKTTTKTHAVPNEHEETENSIWATVGGYDHSAFLPLDINNSNESPVNDDNKGNNETNATIINNKITKKEREKRGDQKILTPKKKKKKKKKS